MEKSNIYSIAAALLVVLGATLLGQLEDKPINSQFDDSGASQYEINQFMGGVSRNIVTDSLSKVALNVAFGGAKIDLTKANLNGRALLDFSTFCGGAEIVIPKDWTVISQGHAIFGGIQVAKSDSMNPQKILVLDGTVLFGGLEVKRKK